MKASEWIALAAVVVSPTAALAGAYLNGALAERSARRRAEERVAERAEEAREQALEALARMDALLLDAEPSLVINNQLREYSTSEAAAKGLIQRWLSLREPLVLLWVTHPDAEVRQAALMFQAEVEICLRHTADAAESDGDITRAREDYAKASERARDLGKLLSPFA